jgi:hypothetical protein
LHKQEQRIPRAACGYCTRNACQAQTVAVCVIGYDIFADLCSAPNYV